ncbi:MAG: hypothetical protein AB8B91_11140 [Rubripirellula sp.]
MNSPESEFDSQPDAVLQCVQHAFAMQTIPARPPMPKPIAPSKVSDPITVSSGPILGGSFLPRLLGAIPVVIACIVLSVALRQPELDSTAPDLASVEVKPDEFSSVAQERDDPQKEPVQKQDERIQQAIKTTTVIESSVNEVPDSDSVQAIRLFNQCIQQQTLIPAKLSAAFGKCSREQNVEYFSGFQAMGIPQGIKSVQPGLRSDQLWIAGENEVAFVYQIDKPKLLNDLAKFSNAIFGDEIFYDMLDGIHRDAEGPQIDLRRLMTSCLTSEVICVTNRCPSPEGDSVLFAFPLTDVPPVADAIRRAAAIEPDSVSISQTNGVLLFSAGENRKAFGLIGNHFLLGDIQLMQAALDAKRK